MAEVIYENGKLYRECGWISAEGYLKFTLDGKTYYSHRYIYEKEYGPLDPDMDVDHINGNKLDNRLENLRAVSRSDNSFNRHKANLNSATGIRGVSWHKASQKYQVQVRGKYGGTFFRIEDTIEAAEQMFREV